MLTDDDFKSLSKSVKGWDARKLHSYGISWPPAAGWRKKLLAEYKGTNLIPKRHGEKEPTPLELEQAESAQRSRELTAAWYLRMSGQCPWRPGEKEVLDSRIEAENVKWNRIQGRIELGFLGQGFPEQLCEAE